MTCQRCLSEASIPLEIDQSYRFVATENEALDEDEDSEEDILVWSRDFDLHGLLEDEILLDLPLIPLHDECQAPAGFDLAAPADEASANADVRQPFADLASLMKKGKA